MWFTWALGRITKDDHCLNKKAERPMGALKIFRSPWLVTTPTATFPEIFNGLLFRSILWMCTRNLKFVTFSSSWDNRGTQKNLGNPWIRPRTLYSKDFNGLLFWWTLWMYRPNLKSVALPVPYIIGGTLKLWAVPGYAHAPFSQQF